MNNMIKNKAMGRKKQREVKPLDDMTSRQVTFSKRRVGVFKKASELCVLTGAEVAVLCESIGGRVFAFGHPSVEHVVDRFLGNNNFSDLSQNNYAAATETHVHEEYLKKQYLEITKEMDIEKNKADKNKEEGDSFWWQQPFEHLEEEELEEYISSMENLMNNLKLRANDMRLIRTSSSMFDASNTLNSNDTGSSDEYLANKNVTIKDYGLPDEFFTINNLTKQDYEVPNEFFTNKDLTTKGYGLPDEFFANKNMTKQDYGVPDDLFTNKNLNTKDYDLPDEFSTNKDLTKHDYGVPGEFYANKNLTTKGYALPVEFFANQKLNLNDDGLLNELLAINDPDFNDELDAFFTDPELPVDCGNNVQVPNIYGNTGNQVQVQLSHINVNLVVPDDYGNTVDLQKFDTDA